MFSLEKWLILTRLLYLPQNGENWGKLIVAKGFKELPKVQNIAQSGHTDTNMFVYRVLEVARSWEDSLTINLKTWIAVKIGAYAILVIIISDVVV